MAGVAFLIFAGSAAAQPTNLYLLDAPTWLHYFCDGSESDPNGSLSIQGAHCYQNLTIPAGATLNITAATSVAGSPQDLPINAFFAFASGACTIAGTISGVGLNPLDGNGGGSGGGGGGAAATTAGTTGADSVLFGSDSAVRAGAGGVGGAVGTTGVSGVTPSQASQHFIFGDALAMGAFGGASGGAGGGNPGPVAGGGGGGVALICGSISFTGSIIVNGGNGASAGGGSGAGGGGGGGGGPVLMVTPSYAANSGTVSSNGGAGGVGDSGGGNGGVGGNGWVKQFVLQ